MDVAELTENEAAGEPPTETAFAPVKLVPVIVTEVPPAVVPVAGLRLVTVGTAAVRYVKWSAETADEVPLLVVTLTSTVPAEPAGAVAVTDESEFTTTPVAAVAPKVTPVVPEKLVP